MSMQVSYKKQIVLYLILLSLVFIVTEFTLHIYDFTDSYCRIGLVNEIGFDDELKSELCKDRNALQVDPITLEITPNQDFGSIHINNFGFRGDDINEKKNADQYRIFMLGGSTMQGDGVADYQTIPYYLQKIFDEKNPEYKIEVINAGCSSCHSFHETAMIKSKIISLEPDLIFAYDGWNDVMREVPNRLKGVIPEAQNNITLEKENFGNKLLSFLREFKIFPTINRMINYGGDSMRFLDRTIMPYDNQYTGEKVIEWKERWNEVCDLLNERDIKSVISIQPLLGSGIREMTKEESLWYKRYDNENLLKDLEIYASEVNNINSCSLTVDLRDSFNGINEPLFFDNGHVGPKGNKIMAEKIYEKILPIIKNELN